jgi:hypothetical protein
VSTAAGGSRAVRTARALVVLLIIDAAISLAFSAVTVAEIGLLRRVRDGGLVSIAEAEANDERVGAVGIVLLVSFLVAGIVWLVWQHRTHAALHREGVRGLAFTSGWAVGWWFIPVASLWKPFQVNREAWKASGGGDGWHTRPTWPLIGAWWAVFLLWNVLNVVAGSVPADADVESYIAFDYVSIAGDLTGVFAAGLAVALVRSIAARLAALEEAGPPLPPRPDTAFH